MTDATIRLATPADAPAIQEIYRHYVQASLVTFETETPDVRGMRDRIEATLERYPYLVVEGEASEGHGVLGYCYASAFRPRAAYSHAAEASIYLDRACKGRGYGRALYDELGRILRRQHVFDLYACIAYRDEEDELLDHTSMRFHERLGFTLCGRFDKCGYKMGTWCDMAWMHKPLGPHPDDPAPFIPFALL